jgi:hypothetical protein
MAKEGGCKTLLHVEWKACAAEYTTLFAQAIYQKRGKDANAYEQCEEEINSSLLSAAGEFQGARCKRRDSPPKAQSVARGKRRENSISICAFLCVSSVSFLL